MKGESRFVWPLVLLALLALLPASAAAAKRARAEGKYKLTQKVISATQPYSSFSKQGKVSTRPATITNRCPKGPCKRFTAKYKVRHRNPWSGQVVTDTAIFPFKETAPGVYKSTRTELFVPINCPGDEIGFREGQITVVLRVKKAKHGVATKLVGTSVRTVDRGFCGAGREVERLTVIKK